MPELINELKDILGAENVLDSGLDFLSSDVNGLDKVAALAIKPMSSDGLSKAVKVITDHNYTVIARGGATSYTGGVIPDRNNSVVIDTSALNNIIEINTKDMYVTVESGITWKALHEALSKTDVRTPFWGPLSGARATVGGAVSQNAILWGSTSHDVSASSVLSVEVVLADGTILNTGSAGSGLKPFFRNYGPDLTGIFLGDTGALGIKTKVTLRLIHRPSKVDFLSFNFNERSKISRALQTIAREGVASTCFGMDPVLQHQRIKRASMAKGVKAIKSMLASADNKLEAIKDATRIATKGKRFIDEHGYSMHVIVEGNSKAEIEEKVERARSICLQEGSEIANSVPRMLYGDPFVDMTTSVGPAGERWLPMHGLFALSDGDKAWEQIEKLFERFSKKFEEHEIVVGYLLAAVSTTTFVVEPVFYWPGPRTIWSETVLSASDLSKLQNFPENAETNRIVNEAREALNNLFDELGAAHLQIGKKYHYREHLQEPSSSLLESLKNAVDPKRLMNPKSLGLD